jgi:hypothetical protein
MGLGLGSTPFLLGLGFVLVGLDSAFAGLRFFEGTGFGFEAFPELEGLSLVNGGFLGGDFLGFVSFAFGLGGPGFFSLTGVF